MKNLSNCVIGCFVSRDESDRPKNLYIKFDFSHVGIDDSVAHVDGDVNVNSPKWTIFITCSSSFSVDFDFGLTIIRRIKIMTIATVDPLRIAIINNSPCDCPSIDTCGTETNLRK